MDEKPKPLQNSVSWVTKCSTLTKYTVVMRCLSSWDMFKPMNLNYVKKDPTALSVWTLRDNFSTLEQYTSIYLFSLLQYPCSLLVLTASPLFLSPPVIFYISPSEKNPLFCALTPLPSVHFCVGFWEGEKNQEGERKKKWMFPLKHVTSVKLTAENNLGLQTSGWMAGADLLLFLRG